jgi:small-conductance mechanosensitive channel
MKTNFLFPNRFRLIGWILWIPAIVLGYLVLFHSFEFSFLDIKVLSLLPDSFFRSTQGSSLLWNITSDNFTQEFAGILFIVSAVFVAFSKEKNEDEYIAKIRLESLLWATYATFAIQILCLLLFYNFTFLTSMIVNMFTILIVFIVRYNYIIYRSKFQNDEK